MKNIHHVSYHRDNYGNSYDSHTGLLRDFFQKLKNIGTYAYIPDARQVKFLIDGIKANNSEMTIGKLSVMKLLKNKLDGYILQEDRHLPE